MTKFLAKFSQTRPLLIKFFVSSIKNDRHLNQLLKFLSLKGSFLFLKVCHELTNKQLKTSRGG